jgi:hypothetical protein
VNFDIVRPKGFEGEGDRHLPGIIDEVTQLLVRAQDELKQDDLLMVPEILKALATVLVEFAEDLHNEIGLWHSLEAYQQEFFGTPLPLVLQPGEPVTEQERMQARVRYLMWVICPEMYPDLTLPPNHPDLIWLAADVAELLTKAFATVPRGSGVKQYLTQPNDFVWQVNQKMIWLGQFSYLFRFPFVNYVEASGGELNADIALDFLCAATTPWSGLGVIDILAATLTLSNRQRADVRRWYDRHFSYYRVETVKGGDLLLKNLLNEAYYRVSMEETDHTFTAGKMILTSLIPWEDIWYWAGPQRIYSEASSLDVNEVKATFVLEMPAVIFCYDSELLERARELMESRYQEFLEHFGDELVIFPHGGAMANQMQGYKDRVHDSGGESQLKQTNGHGQVSAHETARAAYVNELNAFEDEVGVFFNRREGLNMMPGINYVVSGLQRKGQSLSDQERAFLQIFVQSEDVSPAFVERLVQEYGGESIAAAFDIDNWDDETVLPYLLRRYKGEYYRNRYPDFSIIG